MKARVWLLCLWFAFLVAPIAAEATEDSWFVVIGPYPPELLAAGGSGYDDGTWFFYENTSWWNQWFYDHPYDPERSKIAHIEYDVLPETGAFLRVALNWSTPWWSEIGNPPGEERRPPLPPLSPEDEELAIVREVLFSDDYFPLTHYVFDYEIEEYNPEWVSIDVWGWNVELMNGSIIHQCIPPTPTTHSTWGCVKGLFR